MRSVRSADVYSLPNLLRNGGLDFLEPQDDGHLLPHFWSFTGLVPRTESEEAVNSYEVITGETIERRGDLGDYFKINLLDNSLVRINQSFLATNILDFPVPLASGSARKEVAAGFLSKFERLLSRSRDYSIGVSIRVVRGRVNVSTRFVDEKGVVITESDLSVGQEATLTARRWLRKQTYLTPSSTPASISFNIQRVAGSELTEVHIGFFQLVLGQYDYVPYTGDPSIGVLPKDAIVMVMGDTCPPGFVALEEPSGEVPEDWLAVDAEAKIREGNFPIGNDGSGDLKGDPTHNRDTYQFRLDANDTEAFESFDSRHGSATTGSVSYNPNVRTPADEPDETGRADHQHNVRDAGSIPVNRQFKFCRRL